MPIEIREIGPERLAEYAAIPIAFDVSSALEADLVEGGLGGITLHETRVRSPYIKDYDGYAEQGPQRLHRRFNLENWGIFLALEGSRNAGGAMVAFDTPDVHMLEGRRDLAVLWDLRVHPDRRRQGIGTLLFGHAAGWARGRGCRSLKIETQNINVPACQFYRKQGCRLGVIHRHAYAQSPGIEHEVMLLWYLNL